MGVGGASPIAHSSGFGPGWADGTTSDAHQFLPRHLPKGLPAGSLRPDRPDDAARKLGGEGWGGLGMRRDPGPGVWEENPRGKACGLSLQEKNPYPSQLLQVGKGPPHGESHVEGAKEVHLFSGRERGARPPEEGKRRHCRQVGIPRPPTAGRERPTAGAAGTPRSWDATT